MGKEMSPQLANFYADFDAQQRGNRIRLLQETTKGELVKNLFKQAVDILDGYGDDRVKLSNARIRILTPYVTLENGNEKVTFVIKGVKSEAVPDSWQSYLSYESISIHTTKERDGNFEIDNSALFSFTATRTGLVTPIKENNDVEAIQVASDLLDIMQKSLSEIHTPQSQQVKPETGKRGLLVNIFRRLNPAGNL